MIFSSMSFLCSFLPITLVSIYLCPQSYKKILLVLLSLLFYAWGEPTYVVFLCIWIYANHVLGRYIDNRQSKQRKKALWIGIVCNLFFLLYFKYYGQLLSIFFSPVQFSMLPMPLGFSFITFTTLSFLIDVYRKQAKVLGILDTALYISFFPKLLMGPIEPYHRFIKQCNQISLTSKAFDQGVKWFILGLAQKAILADSFQALHEALQSVSTSFLSSWQDAFAYTLWIYFDFHGYSMMAMGIASMLGFSLMKNFDFPYSAVSIQDFWRRWHRSLSLWFRDYVYIPLGGSRVDKKRHILNLFIVWGLTGIWHGTSINFLLWGLYYGCLLTLELYTKKFYEKQFPKPIRKIITFLLVVIGWVIFANPDLDALWVQLTTMFAMKNGPLYTSEAMFYLTSYLGYFIIAFVCICPAIIYKLRTIGATYRYYDALTVLLYMLLFILSLCFIVSSGFQSFLYTQF